MSNALDLTGSFIIGGVVLISLILLALHVSGRTQDTMLSEIAQTSITAVGDVLEDDFTKIGYRVDSGQKILTMTSSQLSFRGDIDNNGVVDTVTYSIAQQYNENVVTRVSSIRPAAQWKIPSSGFTIQYFDSTGNSTAVPSLVRSISIQVTLAENASARKSSPTTVSQTQSGYTPAGAHWRRHFYPRNLR